MAPHSQRQIFWDGSDCWVYMLKTEVLFIQINWLNRQWVNGTIRCWEGHQIPCVLFDLKNAYFPLAACWIQLYTICSWSPFNMVDWTFVMLMLCDLDPLVIFILKDTYFLLETSYCNQLSKLRVGPGDFPYGSLVSEYQNKLPFEGWGLDKVILVFCVDKDIAFWVRYCDFGAVMIVLDIGLDMKR